MDLITVSNTDRNTTQHSPANSITEASNTENIDDSIFTEKSVTNIENSNTNSISNTSNTNNRKKENTDLLKNNSVSESVNSISLFTTEKNLSANNINNSLSSVQTKTNSNNYSGSNTSNNSQSNIRSGKKSKNDHTSEISIKNFSNSNSSTRPNSSNKDSYVVSDRSATSVYRSSQRENSQKGAGFDEDMPSSNTTADDRTIQKLNEVIRRTNTLLGGFKPENDVDNDIVSEYTEMTPKENITTAKSASAKSASAKSASAKSVSAKNSTSIKTATGKNSTSVKSARDTSSDLFTVSG